MKSLRGLLQRSLFRIVAQRTGKPTVLKLTQPYLSFHRRILQSFALTNKSKNRLMRMGVFWCLLTPC